MVSAKIIVDRETGRSKGYGFVLYTEPIGTRRHLRDDRGDLT